jgi:hypothetical protein
MRKSIWTGVLTATVSVATAVLTAQTPTPQTPTPQTPAPQTSASSADRKMTITGCLKEAPASSASRPAAGAAAVGTTGTTGTAGAAGTTGTTGETAAAPKFLLTNATSSPAPAAGAASTTGAASAGAASPSGGQTFRLVANASALSAHVGKKLELTGTLEDQNAATPSEASAGSESNTAAFRVESGKIVAESCSQ